MGDKLHLEHWSDHPKLDEHGIDPQYHGQGVTGQERKRKQLPDWVDRSYHYIKGSSPEDKLGSKRFRYTTSVPEDSVYDMAEDPLNLKQKSKWGNVVDPNLYEKNIKEHGYLGFTNSAHPSMSHVVGLFHTVTPHHKHENSRMEKSGLSPRGLAHRHVERSGDLLEKAKRSRQPNEKVRQIADKYAQKKGLKLEHGSSPIEIDEDRASNIAHAYSQMEHKPDHPEVKQAYNALINETMEQFQHMKDSGLKISPITPDMENPYKNSEDMHRDIRENNHLWFFPTEGGFGSGEESGDHPLLTPTNEKIGGKQLLANDVFRVVHDYFGHAKEGHSFGPKGEEGAWRQHMQMYSPDAQKALTAETRGQNSWVNFGPQGRMNRKNPANTVYAEQKAGILPEWAMKKSSKLSKTDDHAELMQRKYQSMAQRGRPGSLEKGKNIKEQKKRVWGTSSQPPRMSDRRQKMMQLIRDTVKDQLGLDLTVAKGKVDPETGQLRTPVEDLPVEKKPFDVFTEEGRQEEQQRLDQIKQMNIERGKKSMEKAKSDPITIKEYGHLSGHTSSGEPFRVVMATDESHKEMSGAHHKLDRRKSPKDLYSKTGNHIKDPKVVEAANEAISKGHDTLILHNPKKKGALEQRGHLSVMKKADEDEDPSERNRRRRQAKKEGTQTIRRQDPKPDWRSGELQTQPSPDAAIHELAHLLLSPEGKGLGETQEHMDHQFGQVIKHIGFLKQKMTEGEIQPMALENKIRRTMGLPANKEFKNPRPMTEHDRPVEQAVDESGPRFVRGVAEKGGKKQSVDLVRQARLLSPSNAERFDKFLRGEIKFDAEKGWQPASSANAKINQRARAAADDPDPDRYFSRKDKDTLMRSNDQTARGSNMSKSGKRATEKLAKPGGSGKSGRSVSQAQQTAASSIRSAFGSSGNGADKKAPPPPTPPAGSSGGGDLGSTIASGLKNLKQSEGSSALKKASGVLSSFKKSRAMQKTGDRSPRDQKIIDQAIQDISTDRLGVDDVLPKVPDHLQDDVLSELRRRGDSAPGEGGMTKAQQPEQPSSNWMLTDPEDIKKFMNIMAGGPPKKMSPEAKQKHQELQQKINEFVQAGGLEGLEMKKGSSLEKKQGVPKGVDPQKHESCVEQVKEQGHDKESAYRICNSSLKKARKALAKAKRERLDDHKTPYYLD